MYIPKPDGRLRPLGVAALEDKVLQRAVVEVLNAIYETDFLGFSYGFRPGRQPHQALDALAVGIRGGKVNWVLDADIRDYFTSLDHVVAAEVPRAPDRGQEGAAPDPEVAQGGGHRGRGVVGDAGGDAAGRVGLDAALRTSTSTTCSTSGPTSGGGGTRAARCVVVRFADDIVVGFQHRDDAERFRADLRERLAQFNLELDDEKTRLIEFGRFAARDRERRASASPRRSSSWASRTSARRTGRTVQAEADHEQEADAGEAAARSRPSCGDGCICPIPEQGEWLGRVVQGHLTYYAVPDNSQALRAFRDRSHGTGGKRSGVAARKRHVTWERMRRLADRWLPQPRILHPWPNVRFNAKTQGRSPVR